MIKNLSLGNYRAFENANIPLTKINLFFGPNNSGKSVILSAINLLSQTLDSTDREVPLLLNGKFENLGTYKNVVFRNEPERDITLGLEFDTKGLRFFEQNSEKSGIDVTFHYRKQRREIVARNILLSSPPGKTFLRTRVAETGNNQVIDQVGPMFSRIKVGPSSYGSVKLQHFVPFLDPSLGRISSRRPSLQTSSRYAPYHLLDRQIYLFTKSLNEHLRNIEFIGPFRRSPERTYIFSGETPSSVGVHGEKALDILAADKSRRHGKKRNIAERISQWLQRSQIAKEFELLTLTDQHFEVSIAHFDTGEHENLADVGYGCSQILPILVAGYHLPSKSALIIQQPEIHLHPKAEAEVGTFLFDVSKRDIQILVETHSEHLLLRLQSHVAAGDLTPSDINIFYVYSDQRTNQKICDRIPLGKDGFFEQNWPRGFFPERLEEAKRLAKFSI